MKFLSIYHNKDKLPMQLINELFGEHDYLKTLPNDIYEKIMEWGELSGEGKYINEGSFGATYAFGDKVLKLTTDRHEVVASALVREQNLPQCIKFYKMGSIDPDRFKGLYKATLYLLTMEKIQPLNKGATKNNVAQLIRGLYPYLHLYLEVFDNEELESLTSFFVALKKASKIKKQSFDTSIQLKQALVRMIVDFAGGYGKPNREYAKYAYQYITGVKSIRDHGISYPDPHVNNIGIRDNGDLMFFDFGVALKKTPRWHKEKELDIIKEEE